MKGLMRWAEAFLEHHYIFLFHSDALWDSTAKTVAWKAIYIFKIVATISRMQVKSSPGSG
jgi:hypothetical protein